jgi:hypothetical protein
LTDGKIKATEELISQLMRKEKWTVNQIYSN